MVLPNVGERKLPFGERRYESRIQVQFPIERFAQTFAQFHRAQMGIGLLDQMHPEYVLGLPLGVWYFHRAKARLAHRTQLQGQMVQYDEVGRP